jgi:hypothetical protein
VVNRPRRATRISDEKSFRFPTLQPNFGRVQSSVLFECRREVFELLRVIDSEIPLILLRNDAITSKRFLILDAISLAIVVLIKKFLIATLGSGDEVNA